MKRFASQSISTIKNVLYYCHTPRRSLSLPKHTLHLGYEHLARLVLSSLNTMASKGTTPTTGAQSQQRLDAVLQDYQNWCKLAKVPAEINGDASTISSRLKSYLTYRVEQSRRVDQGRDACMTWEDLKDLGRQLRNIAVTALNLERASILHALIDLGIKGHCYELTNTHPVVVQKRTIKVDCSIDESGEYPEVTRTVVRDDDQDSFDAWADEMTYQDHMGGGGEGFDLGDWLNGSDECQ
jgi:hypothetical protein